MTLCDYLVLSIGTFFFYVHKVKTLSGHMSLSEIMIYATLKIGVLFITPALMWTFSYAFLGLKEPTVSGLVLSTFIVTLLILTVREDKKTGLIDEVIRKSKGYK